MARKHTWQTSPFFIGKLPPPIGQRQEQQERNHQSLEPIRDDRTPRLESEEWLGSIHGKPVLFSSANCRLRSGSARSSRNGTTNPLNQFGTTGRLGSKVKNGSEAYMANQSLFHRQPAASDRAAPGAAGTEPPIP